MHHIRKAKKEDVSRIAEIYVFNNRINFYPIFKDTSFSFHELQVVPLAKSLLVDSDTLDDTYVYDDHQIIKGFIYTKDKEIKKLFVDPFFQGQNIGEKLLEYAMEYQDISFLWALEKISVLLNFIKDMDFHSQMKKNTKKELMNILLN